MDKPTVPDCRELNIDKHGGDKGQCDEKGIKDQRSRLCRCKFE